jgi:hypothetical protein
MPSLPGEPLGGMKFLPLPLDHHNLLLPFNLHI